MVAGTWLTRGSTSQAGGGGTKRPWSSLARRHLPPPPNNHPPPGTPFTAGDPAGSWQKRSHSAGAGPRRACFVVAQERRPGRVQCVHWGTGPSLALCMICHCSGNLALAAWQEKLPYDMPMYNRSMSCTYFLHVLLFSEIQAYWAQDMHINSSFVAFDVF
jgi:hypothetical protein